jgi:hypothetical protein
LHKPRHKHDRSCGGAYTVYCGRVSPPNRPRLTKQAIEIVVSRGNIPRSDIIIFFHSSSCVVPRARFPPAPCDVLEEFAFPEKLFGDGSLFLDGLLFVDESRFVDGSLFVNGSRLVDGLLCDAEPFWLLLDERVLVVDDALEIGDDADDVDVELFILLFFIL